jgi:hypothetical protein
VTHGSLAVAQDVAAMGAEAAAVPERGNAAAAIEEAAATTARSAAAPRSATGRRMSVLDVMVELPWSF